MQMEAENVLGKGNSDVQVPEVTVFKELEVAGTVVTIFESCHSLWLLDSGRMRFRRLPRGTRVDIASVNRDWVPYYHLEIDVSAGRITMALSADGTRILRSWIHQDFCRHCQARDSTGEVFFYPASADDRPNPDAQVPLLTSNQSGHPRRSTGFPSGPHTHSQI